MKKCLMGLAFAALIAGCTTPTTRIDLRNDRGPQVAGLDYRDVQYAANARCSASTPTSSRPTSPRSS